MAARGSFRAGNVETITKARPDGSEYTIYRVRWTNAETGKRYTYGGLDSLADGEDFRVWLRLNGGRVTAAHAALVDGTWRIGDAASVGIVVRTGTFRDYALANIAKRDVNAGTRKGLVNLVDAWFADIANYPMTSFTQALVRGALDRLEMPRTFPVGTKGKTRTVTLSSSTVIQYSWFLWGIFTAAVKDKTIPAHPFGDIELPTPENARRRLTDESFNLSVDHYGTLLNAASDIDAQAFAVLRLILVTGLRIGEALGLQVRHLDMIGARIMVRQSVKRDGTVGLVKKGTRHERSDSERDVPLPPDAVAWLSAYLTSCGVTAADGGRFLFPRPRSVRGNSPWSPSAWHRARWQPILATAHDTYGLPSHVTPTPHCLRHTYASRMLNAGMSVYDVSKLLGHKDTKITERIYLHSCHDDMHKRARGAAALILPAENAAPTLLRNGWYVGADGVKRRRTAA